MDCIIDAGANTGKHGRFLREDIGNDKLITSFEPDPTTYNKLSANIGNDALSVVYNQALGDESGGLTFNVMKNSLLNSFLEPYDGETKPLATLNAYRIRSQYLHGDLSLSSRHWRKPMALAISI